jgi:stage V sporulation protein B
MQEQKNPTFLKGAAILAATGVLVKIIGAIYKIPLFQDGVLGEEGTGDFNVTYSVYAFVLAISTAGVPAALSRLVSAANAKGDKTLVRRFFSVALSVFMLIGISAMLLMFFLADSFAGFMGNSMAALGIRVLAPAVFFACILSVYRGYAQGHENMVPTAISQIIEVICKTVFGIAVALWLVSLGRDSHIISAGAIVGVTIGLGLCLPVMVWFKKRLDRRHTSGTGAFEVPGKADVMGRILKVSIPIAFSASFMSLMVVIDNSIVLNRLQTALEMTEAEARALFGIFSRAQSIHNLPPSLVVPVSISAAALARKDGEAAVIMQSSVKLVNLIAMPASAGIIVLANPILIALYNDPRQITTTILTLLGAASFFVCLQYITTAILQANGHERVALLTFPIGAVIKIVIGYVLAGNPNFGIIGSPIGTLVCFIVISALNIGFIMKRVKDKPKFGVVFLKPLLCSAIMAAIAYLLYSTLFRLGYGILGTGRIAVTFYLAVAIAVSIAVYAVLIVITRTITAEDMKLVPKGEKLAKMLRLK